MADVVIRGMKMPKDCASCAFCVNELCQKCCGLTGNYYGWKESSNGKRPTDCPIQSLPEKHGDLMDKAAFEKEV